MHRTVVKTSHVLPGGVTETEVETLAVVGVTATRPGLVPLPEEPRMFQHISAIHHLHTTIRLPRMRLFSPAQSTKASRLVRYAWPQTLMTLGSVVPRPFGMDPRPDVARARKEDLSHLQVPPCAATGTTAGAAPPLLTSNGMNVLGAEARITELRSVLELRRDRKSVV